MNHLQVIFNHSTQGPKDISISLAGVLNSMNSNNFKQDLCRLVAVEKSNCTVNLEKLESIDLSGLNALAMAHKHIEQNGSSLKVVCKKENPIDQFLSTTQFDNYLNVERA